MRRYSPFDEMFDMFRDFDTLFRRTMGEFRELPADVTGVRRLLPASPRSAQYYPAVECFIKDKQLVLKAELPGVDPKDVEVSVAGNQLVLKGEKRQDHTVEEKDLFLREIARGRFERSFTLPDGVRKEQVKATFTNGVLEVCLPAEGMEMAKKVPIEIAETGKKGVKAA